MIKNHKYKSWLMKDVIIALIILAMSLLFYAYLYIPEQKSITVLGVSIHSGFFEDVSIMIWIFTIKLIFIITYSIWFITCKHWWRYAILVPLLFSINQLIVVANSELYYIDDNEFLASIILSIPIISLLFLLSKKINYYNASMNLTESLDKEIQNLWIELFDLTNQDCLDVKRKLIELRIKKDEYEQKAYLEELIKLRSMIERAAK